MTGSVCSSTVSMVMAHTQNLRELRWLPGQLAEAVELWLSHGQRAPQELHPEPAIP